MAMKPIVLACLVWAPLVWAGDAADDVDYEQRYGQCVDKAGSINNSVVYACADEVAALAEQEIQRHYHVLMQRLNDSNPSDARVLASTQKAWTAYREKQCHLAGAYIGSPMYSYCPMQMNSSRAYELRDLVQ